ncbi:MAG: hypothetical protein ABL967_03035 [Bryobacteraceae bacterium]
MNSSDVLAFMSAIPAPAWVVVGAIIGALSSLLATGITTWFQFKREERARLMALRRDVYLDAVEAVSALQAHIGNACDIEQPPQTAEISHHLATLSKVYLIGSQESVEATLRVSGWFTSTYTDLNQRRMKLNLLRKSLTPREFSLELLELIRSVTDSLTSVSELTANGILALRADLELLTDKESYLEITRRHNRDVVEGLERFRTQMESTVRNLPEDQAQRSK